MSCACRAYDSDKTNVNLSPMHKLIPIRLYVTRN